MRQRELLSGVSALPLVAFGVMTASAPSAGATALQRPADPVVLTGADTPTLQGLGPAAIVGFAFSGGAWHQIPVQVDERALVDLGKAYNQAPNGVAVLSYTSPQTFAGKDPNPKFDADDELAFMARDAGDVATGAPLPTGVVAGTGVEVHVTDPLAPGSEGYVYLFKKAYRSGLQQGARKHYVKYTFHLASGSYKLTYKLTAGPNPENSTVTGATYTQHFADRWLTDSIKVTAPSASGSTYSTAPRRCSRRASAFAVRTPSTQARARSS
jgi:hypothetical protein